jgi:transposase
MARASTDQATGLLGYTKTRMTNGRMEGINRKIKPLRQQAYGFRDDGFPRLQLYARFTRPDTNLRMKPNPFKLKP